MSRQGVVRGVETHQENSSLPVHQNDGNANGREQHCGCLEEMEVHRHPRKDFGCRVELQFRARV